MLARWLMRTVQCRLCFGFLLEGSYGELRLANHQHAAGAQTEDRRCARKNRKSGGQMVQSGLAVISADRTADGDQRGGGKQSESCVEAAQGSYEKLRTQV